MYWGFKKIPFRTYTDVLARISQSGARLIKNLTPDFTNHMRSLENFKQAMKKLKFNGLVLSKKYIPSAKTLYT